MPTQMDATALVRFIEGLQLLREATGNSEMQAQTMMMLAYVAYRHPNEVPYQEAEKQLGLSQTSTSRNAKYLSDGFQRPNQTDARKTDTIGGYGYVSVREDPYYVKRKLISMTPAGLKVAERLCRVLAGAK